MEGIVDTSRGTVRILCRNKATVDAAEADVSTPKRPVDKPTDPEKATLTRSEINAAQMIHVLPMTQVQVMDRCLLPGLVHTEQKHAIFVKRRLRLTNCIQQIYPEKPFIVVVATFSNMSEDTQAYGSCLRHAKPNIYYPYRFNNG